MANIYPISGKLITKAIRAISVNTGMSIKALEHMYATQLGYSLATIKGWKTGRSRPTSRDAVWILAKDGIEKGGLPKEWLLTFADELNLPNGFKSELLQALITNNKTELENKIPVKGLSVFLCHSSSDKASVRNLFNKLKDDGFQPWLDEVSLLPGQDWDLEIRRAVHNCDVVIICLSTSSATKEGYIQKEIKIALDIADEKPQDIIFLIPLRLEECEPPIKMQKWQWVDLHKKEGYEKLVISLKKRAQQLGRVVEKSRAFTLISNNGDPKQRASLFETINLNFDISDIQEICFKTFIDFDNLSGITKTEKAIELILYCERVNRLADLEKSAKAMIAERI
jgi:hypothetical protein